MSLWLSSTALVPEEAAVNLVEKDQDAEFELPVVSLSELKLKSS